MFTLGFEESTDNFLASVKRSWDIALAGDLGFGQLVQALGEAFGGYCHCYQSKTDQVIEVII